MHNAYRGETEVTLCDKKYPLLVNLEFKAQFRSATGKDFNAFAAKTLAAWEASEKEESFFARNSIMADAVPEDLAAYAFYLSAKLRDSQVTLEEMEDAVARTGCIERKDIDGTYPVMFCKLAYFALVGIYHQEDKKKDLEQS